MMPQLSLVIINWNAWSHLRRCLASFRAQEDAVFEIVVIDNASTDGSADNLHKYFPKVRVHANPTNIGHTRAVNQGLMLARGEYVLLLDADTEIGRDSINALLRFLINRPDISVVGPRTYNTDGSIQETARNFPSFMSGLFGRHSFLTRLFPNNGFSRRYLLRDKLNASEPFAVEQVSAACMMIRRSVLAECGPWDEGFKGYWVDTDWCMKLKKMGKTVFCIPQARAVHHENNDPGKKQSPRRIWMFHLGAYRLYRKHYTWGALDPRAAVALAALTARATLLTARNLVRSETVTAPREPTPSPASVPDERFSNEAKRNQLPANRVAGCTNGH
jgi:GT2 family glycosyltransferase